MDRSIINNSLKAAAFFFLISFILKVIFYSNLFSLLVYPVLISFGWLIFTAGILFFLKHDFPEIYKIFFPYEKINDTDSGTHNKTKNISHKNLEVQIDDNMDYNEIHQEEKISSSDKQEEINQSKVDKKKLSKNTEHSSKSIGADAFSESDPKDLAKVVKKFLNEEE